MLAADLCTPSRPLSCHGGQMPSVSSLIVSASMQPQPAYTFVLGVARCWLQRHHLHAISSRSSITIYPYSTPSSSSPAAAVAAASHAIKFDVIIVSCHQLELLPLTITESGGGHRVKLVDVVAQVGGGPRLEHHMYATRFEGVSWALPCGQMLQGCVCWMSGGGVPLIHRLLLWQTCSFGNQWISASCYSSADPNDPACFAVNPILPACTLCVPAPSLATQGESEVWRQRRRIPGQEQVSAASSDGACWGC